MTSQRIENSGQGAAAKNRRAICFSLLSVLFSGCSDNHQTVRERQDTLLSDPFSYKVDDTTKEDISGGQLGELNRDALRKDLDSVLNP